MTATFDVLAERPWKRIAWLVLAEAGVVVEPDRVRLPYREPDGAVRYWRVKSACGREWFEPKPTSCGGLIPFGLETLPRTSDRERLAQTLLLVTEGESDCLALREAIAEWTLFPVGVYVLGLPGARSWHPEWRRRLSRFPTIYVIPDGDRPGAAMAVRIRTDLPWARFVRLPASEDARSLVQAGGGEALAPHLDEANRLWRADAAFRLAHDYDEFVRIYQGRA